MFSAYCNKKYLRIEVDCDANFLKKPNKCIQEDNFLYGYLKETVCYPGTKERSFFKRILLACSGSDCPFVKKRLQELIGVEFGKSKILLISLLCDRHFLIHLHCKCKEEANDFPSKDELSKDLTDYESVIMGIMIVESTEQGEDQNRIGNSRYFP